MAAFLEEEIAMIFTIGHGSLSLEEFFNLLFIHQIKRLLDIRSAPYCKYAVWFNKEAISSEAARREIAYSYLGHLLGGFPKDKNCLCPDGNPDYELMAQSKGFKTGLNQVIKEARQGEIVLMCSEKDPYACHRHKLVSKALLEEGVKVAHILSDGSLRYPELKDFKPEPSQLSLW
ncbi:MAG: DUF488 domain-containing protein [bacterium]|nr:DUF488 domain-containing protein [bacterium]